MGKKLVIVESPTKVKSIGKYLGSDYVVSSSKGHIRDLSTKGKYGFGVDIDDNFKPNYTTIKGKKKVIDELKKDAKKADKVYLATDLDREGEAIAWHLYDVLGLKDENYSRVVFNEITKNTILEAIKNERKIDKDLVNSQETRRILDRIIGFRLSKLIQSKTDGTSAGRVQSVALKLIVDKEREIEAFNPVEYWTITADFNEFKADLFKYKTKKIEIKTEAEADNILSKLSKSFEIEDIEKKLKNKSSRPPFTTSTLQQTASNKLRFSSRKTMQVAQRLYEGIDIDVETAGLITYMRTDSIRLSNDFVSSCYNFIENKYGEEFKGAVKVSKKTENVQDAHEGIRPTDINRTPESIKKYLSDDEYKLYRLIYYRALASVMAPAKVEGTTVILNNNDYKFKTTGQIIVFEGYLKVYKDYEDTKDTILPPFDKYNSNVIVSKDITKEQHFTEPPARYTEAKLIKEMDDLGIGRPSTYATIIDNIKKRGYVNLVERKFVPTEVGIEVTDKLQEFFSNLINVEYTANMEVVVPHKVVDCRHGAVGAVFDRQDPEAAKAVLHRLKDAFEGLAVHDARRGEELVAGQLRIGALHALAGHERTLREKRRCRLLRPFDRFRQFVVRGTLASLIGTAQVEQRLKQNACIVLKLRSRHRGDADQDLPLPRGVIDRQAVLFFVCGDHGGRLHAL